MIDQHRVEIVELCRRYTVRRLEVFGSAARGRDFDPASSDADFLVEFLPTFRRLLNSTTSPMRWSACSRVQLIWLSGVRSRPVEIISAGARYWPAPSQFMADRREITDTALLLDMLLTAHDAIGSVSGLSEAAFLNSRLHQNPVIRPLEVIGGSRQSVGGVPTIRSEYSVPRAHWHAPSADSWLRGCWG